MVFGDVFHTPAQLAQPPSPSRPGLEHSEVTAARRRIAGDAGARPGDPADTQKRP
ncbi:hypothetical protein [Streptomyces sp. NPDC046988]|uniref:hypothetical protein n=1 Tax=Streptomyces sp. NPDC046988 TaxID=3154922 RepID=UPI0033EBE7C8